jgi:hypothetical protein
MLRRHNPILRQRLLQPLQAGDIKGLQEILANLKSMDFKTAGFLLAEEVLPTLEEQTFWKCFLAIVPTNAKAYLGTFLKAAIALHKQGRLTLTSEALEAYAQTGITPIDCRKVLEALLPLARGHEEIAFLLHCFTSDVQQRIALLLRINTLPAAYTLFREMKTQEEDLALLRSTCLALMKRGDARAFRLASLCVSYFGLEAIPGTFSLTLQPYELSRLDQSYETFKACFD